jgi:hypothetical protein
MAKRVVRTNYLSKKQMHNAYINYKRRYRAKEKSMKRRGLEMADKMLNKAEYEMVRAEAVADGLTRNINQTIVSNQQYEYSQDIARQFKRVSKEFDLEWKNLTITQIRTGEIDVSGLNQSLKERFPEMTGKQRQQWISYEVFGSE